MKKILYSKFALLAIIILLSTQVIAQLNPMGAQFYLNQYIGNPAMAGLDTGLNVGLGYRKQMASIVGGPQDQLLTGEYRFKKVGLGINIYNEKAGLIKKTRTVATYAYHLLLNNSNEQLHFGLSMGFLNERIYEQDIVGNTGDIAVGALNRREVYLDGDFGVAYTSNSLTVQGAIPNLKSFFKKDFRNVADRATFYSAISYKISTGSGLNGVIIEPKLTFRGVKGFDNLYDIGSNFSFLKNAISAFAMYHNTNSATFGFGALILNNTLQFQGLYTTETAALRGVTNGNFEVNLKYRIF